MTKKTFLIGKLDELLSLASGTGEKLLLKIFQKDYKLGKLVISPNAIVCYWLLLN